MKFLTKEEMDIQGRNIDRINTFMCDVAKFSQDQSSWNQSMIDLFKHVKDVILSHESRIAELEKICCVVNLPNDEAPKKGGLH